VSLVSTDSIPFPSFPLIFFCSLQDTRPSKYQYHLSEEWVTAFFAAVDIDAALGLTTAAMVALANMALKSGKAYSFYGMDKAYQQKPSFDGRRAARCGLTGSYNTPLSTSQSLQSPLTPLFLGGFF